MGETLEDLAAKREVQGEPTSALKIHPRLLDAAYFLPLGTGLLFVLGWVYNLSYYRVFSVEHTNLGLPLYVYLMSPWFALISALVLIPVLMLSETAGRRFAERRMKAQIGAPALNDQGDALWKRLLDRTHLATALINAGGLGYTTGHFLVAVGESPTLGVMLGLAGFWYVHVHPAFETAKLDRLKLRATRMIRLTVMTLCFLLMSTTAKQGEKHAIAHSLKGNTTLPGVAIIWDEPAKPGLPDPIREEYLALRLLFASPSELYVFHPRESAEDKMSRTYCISRSKVRYFTLR